VKVYLALNTYPQPHNWPQWEAAVDRAATLQVDAIIVADLGVLDYAAERHPDLPRHLSVQGSATSHEALRFYHERFGIRRAVLPRVLSLAQVRQVIEHSPVAIEVFGFGSLCVMVEGRCLLSSYATGKSPNTCGACSPAEFVRWEETPAGRTTRLGGVLLDRRAAGETAGYPTICKGRYDVGGRTFYAIEEPTSLNTLELLPELMALGVVAVKIEGRQRSPAYVRDVTRVWRAAIDACRRNAAGFRPAPEWSAALARLSEGAQTTFGALHRPWQ
jgi:putative protease